MKIAICEDVIACSDALESLIRKWANNNGVFVEISTYDSAEQFLFSVEDERQFDLLILDIRMGEMNGIELAHKLRELEYKIQIVFTTYMLARAITCRR